jgi:hypothetical protein
MTVVVRRINANPVRTGTEAWEFIVDLISTPNSDARAELKKAEGFGASVIAEEYPKEKPIVVVNEGPRLRVYCLYGEVAIAGDNSDESGLSWNATHGDWAIYLPVSEGDLKWMKESLSKLSSKVIPYGPDDQIANEINRPSSTGKDLKINPETLKRL